MRQLIPALHMATLFGGFVGCLRRFDVGRGLDFDWRGSLLGRRAAALTRGANDVSARFALLAVLSLAA